MAGHDDEAARLTALRSLDILDTAPEQGFNDIVRLAGRLCGTPTSLVSLVDEDRQWFKARVGFPVDQTDLDRSVCKHALAAPDLFVIPDLTADPRTAANPLVTGEPGIRFYAGAPLRTASGHALGSLCVIDTVPRPQGLTPEQADDLRALGRQTVDLIELRRAITSEKVAQAEAVADAAKLEAIIATQQIVAGATADLDAVFGAIVAGALTVIDHATGAVVELRDADELVYRATAGTSTRYQGTRLPLIGTLSGHALHEQKPVHCPDTEVDPAANAELARSMGIRAMIVVPVFREGIALGVLKVQADRPHAFDARDILMVQMLASLVAAGLGEVAEVETRQALRDAESRYKAIFDSAIDFAIVTADPDERITDWNVGAERIMGWGPDDVRGRSLATFFTPEDRAAGVPEWEERTAELTGSADDERWHLRRDGERFWAVGRMMALRHEDESVRGYLKILQDRTREWRREQRLALIARASEALHQAGDPAEALMPVLTEGAKALGFEQSYVWDIAADGRHLLLRHTIGVSDADRQALARVSFDVPLCGIVAAEGKPLVLSDLQSGDEPRYAIARDAGIDAYASYPITSDGRCVGVISYATRQDAAFDDEALAFFATVSRFLSIARQRRDALTALAASDERSTLAEEGGRIGTFEVDVASGMTTVSAEMCRIYGLPEEPVMPADKLTALVVPEDAAIPTNDATRRAGTAKLDVEYRIRRARDGALRWISRRASYEHGEDGDPIRMFGTVQDVTDRRQLQQQQTALVELGDRLREAPSSAEVSAIAADLLGRTLRLSRAGFMLIDRRAGTFTVERDWTTDGVPSLIGTHDLAPFSATIAYVEGGATLASANLAGFRALEPDTDGYKALGLRAQIKVPLVENGRLIGLLFAHQNDPRAWTSEEIAFAHAVADRTYAALAKVRAEEGQQLLNNELSHRLKNTLSMVMSIASQTLRSVPDREPVELFERRVTALSSAHDVLLQQSFAGAAIERVVRQVLDASGQAERIDVSGPSIDLGSRSALAVSLMLHELATNAAKYGALSNEAGRVELAWRVDGKVDSDLILTWKERGGPPVVAPTRRGFGSRVIRMGLIGTGGVTLDYAEAGLIAEMKAPLAEVQRS